MVTHRVRRALAVGEQVFVAPRLKRRCEPFAELDGPGRRRGVMRLAAKLAKVVRRTAGTEDEHVLLSQRPQRLADMAVVGGAPARLHRSW